MAQLLDKPTYGLALQIGSCTASHIFTMCIATNRSSRWQAVLCGPPWCCSNHYCSGMVMGGLLSLLYEYYINVLRFSDFCQVCADFLLAQWLLSHMVTLPPVGRGAKKANRRTILHRMQLKDPTSIAIYSIFCWTFNIMWDTNGLFCLPPPELQNVKGVFDAAIKVVLQPPKAKKKKKAQRGACSILWSNHQ